MIGGRGDLDQWLLADYDGESAEQAAPEETPVVSTSEAEAKDEAAAANDENDFELVATPASEELKPAPVAQPTPPQNVTLYDPDLEDMPGWEIVSKSVPVNLYDVNHSSYLRRAEEVVTYELPRWWGRHKHKIAPFESGLGTFSGTSATFAMLGLDYMSAGSLGLIFAGANMWVQHKHITKRISRHRDGREFKAPEVDEKQTLTSNFRKSLAVIASSTGEAAVAGVKTMLETDNPYLSAFAGGVEYTTHTYGSGQSCFAVDGQNVKVSLAGRVAQFISFDYQTLTEKFFDLPELIVEFSPSYQGVLQLFSNNACFSSYGLNNPYLRWPLAFVGGLPLAGSQVDIYNGLNGSVMKSVLDHRVHQPGSMADWISHGAKKVAWASDRILTCSTDALQYCGISPAAQTRYFNLASATVKGMTTGMNGAQKFFPVIPYYIAAPIGAAAYLVAQKSYEDAAYTVGLRQRFEERYGHRVDDHVSARALTRLSVVTQTRNDVRQLTAPSEWKQEGIELSNFKAAALKS